MANSSPSHSFADAVIEIVRLQVVHEPLDDIHR